MFTGIIQKLGKIEKIEPNSKGQTMWVQCESQWLSDISLGDSISVNGVCLSVESKTEEHFTVYCISQTLSQTNLGKLQKHHIVNLEKALTLKTPMGGHWVLGHIDGTGEVKSIQRLSDQTQELEVFLSDKILRYCIDKGSITLNGVSLTIAEVLEKSIRVALIPITLKETNFNELQKKTSINVEVDVLAKYIEKIFPNKN